MMRLYPDSGHPYGITMTPWFSIQDGSCFPRWAIPKD